MIVTLVFKADVDAQGGAYATGVLVLISSAAFAVTLSARAAKQRGLTIMFAAITLVFLYTTIANVIERPDGIRIAGIFILGIITISLISRTFRTFELRISSVKFDAAAQKIIDQLALGDYSGTKRLFATAIRFLCKSMIGKAGSWSSRR